MIPIDRLDRRILNQLQQNGRIKHTALARKLGVPQSTLLERVRRLEGKKIIRGYKAVIDPEQVGLSVQAFVSVRLSRHEADGIRKFEDAVRMIPEIRACYHLSGHLDYLVQVAAPDLRQLGNLVKTKITGLPCFERAETYVIFSEIKPDDGWPIDKE